jgi:hypothetical protein
MTVTRAATVTTTGRTLPLLELDGGKLKIKTNSSWISDGWFLPTFPLFHSRNESRCFLLTVIQESIQCRIMLECHVFIVVLNSIIGASYKRDI